jgi:hypothetical protein
VPYHAFIPLLRALLQMNGDDGPPNRRQQIRTRLQDLHPVLAEDEPLLSHLLGIQPDAKELPRLSPEAWKRRLQHVCQQLILAQAAERPLCLLIEDGHWLDNSSSRELLDLLVMSLVNRPILLLATARPGFRHTWDDLTHFHRLTVEPLPEAQTDVLVRQYFQPHDASLALKALIRDRTGGNPFFVEELLRALEDQELLTLKAGAHVGVPSSVHAVLAARLDRLPPEEKLLLQTAAVIGMEVPLFVLEAVAGEPEDVVDRGLLHLQGLEFLYEAGHLPERTLAFKHALTHEVVYGSLLRGRRRALHAQILETLEAYAPDRLDEHVEILAHHALVGEMWEKAFVYLYKAGDKARQAYATQESIDFYTHAIEVSERITPTLDAAQLFPLYEGRGLVRMLLTDYDAAIADFQHMGQLARASGNSQKKGKVWGIWRMCIGWPSLKRAPPSSNSMPRRRFGWPGKPGIKKLWPAALSASDPWIMCGGTSRKRTGNSPRPCGSAGGRGTKTPWRMRWCFAAWWLTSRGSFRSRRTSVRRAWPSPGPSTMGSPSCARWPSCAKPAGVLDSTPRHLPCRTKAWPRRKSGGTRLLSVISPTPSGGFAASSARSRGRLNSITRA